MFTTRVVGVTFMPDYPSNLLDLTPRFKKGLIAATLTREPTNIHDANAIAVEIDNHRVGYLPRYVAERLAPEIDRGTSWFACALAVIVDPTHRERPGLALYLFAQRPVQRELQTT